MKTFNLRARILIPLSIVSVLTLTAFVAALVVEGDRRAAAELARTVEAIRGVYEASLRERAQKLFSAMEPVKADAVVRGALQASDRASLLARVTPVFRRLKERLGVSRVYFHDPRQVNLLRVHRPEQYGDSIAHQALRRAAATGKAASGVGFDAGGGLTLHAAMPVRERGRVVGYVEFGEPVERLLESLASSFGVKLFVAINPRYLTRPDRKAGMPWKADMSDRNRIPAAVITRVPAAMSGLLDAVLRRGRDSFPQGRIELAWNDRLYHAAFDPLPGLETAAAGMLVVLKDVTAQSRDHRSMLLSISAGALSLGGLLVVFVYWRLGQAEQRLDKSQQGLRLSMDRLAGNERRIRQAESLSARMGRILATSWNEIYTFEADSLRFMEVSDGACRNLGYSLEEMRRLTPLDLKPCFTAEQFEALLRPLRSGEEQLLNFETEHRRKDGSRYPVEVRLQLCSVETPPVFVAIIQDISERKHYIAELEHKALYDDLTDLPNRSLLQDRLYQALKVARREAAPLAVLLLDVVRLQEINDILGHSHGDQVLQEVARRLQRGLRESDTVARLGGDAFAMVLPATDIGQVAMVARKIQRLFEQAITVDDTPLEIEVVIGIALYPEHGDLPDLLLQHADIAMRIAKSEADGISIYDPQDDPFSLRRLKLLGELRHAINDQALTLYYQPKIDVKRGVVSGVEALARWPHSTDGMIPPADFIPMIEQSGLIRPFTLWVLEKAIIQCKRWSESGIDLAVAVNLSTRNLLDPGLADSIAGLLEAYGVSAGRLTLEITESAVMSRPEYALKVLTQLNAMGLKLSIDDFGTGYSSLAYLKKLPVHELKIDQSFVVGLTLDDSDAVIVRSTIELAHNLSLQAVAEGVENRAILERLAAWQCDVAQGYHFSRPLPAPELEAWLEKNGR